MSKKLYCPEVIVDESTDVHIDFSTKKPYLNKNTKQIKYLNLYEWFVTESESRNEHKNALIEEALQEPDHRIAMELIKNIDTICRNRDYWVCIEETEATKLLFKKD